MIWLVVALLAAVGFARIVYWVSQPLVQSFWNRPATDYEQFFEDPNAPQLDSPTSYPVRPFPSLFEEASVSLSVIAPAYNEEARIDEFLDEAVAYLTERERRSRASPRPFSWEIIVVDDGSRDRTYAHVLESYGRRLGSERLRVMRLAENQGKGGAVQQGMLHARGELLLMADSDGATKFADIERLEAELVRQQARLGNPGGAAADGALGVVVGSRAHLEEQAIAQRKWYRTILMHGFHFAVSYLGGVRGIRDTQCGFKVFTRAAARLLFFNQRLRRWCFDVELLYLAGQLRIPVSEVAVQWTEIPGSKLDVIGASLSMARDLVAIRLAYTIGLWTVRVPPAAFLPQRR